MPVVSKRFIGALKQRAGHWALCPAACLSRSMSRPRTAGVPPTWTAWDSGTYADHFRGKELTLVTVPALKGNDQSTHRVDYPKPPLYWKPNPPPDYSNREVAEFPWTTTHRDTFKKHSLGGLMPARHPYPEQKFHPKLQASTTTREGFPRHQLPPARPRTAQIAHQTPDIPIGSTTMRDDYVQWGFQPRHQTPTQHASRPTKFHGITTTRSDFPWPAKIQPPPSMYNTNRDSRPVPEFEGDTTYRQAYGKVELPRGMPADIGIQVASKPYAQGGVGGQFELMIQQRKAAPQVATKTFTTAQDGQPAVAIVVVAKRAEYSHGVILGTFTMEGIKSAPTGVPKIEVTIKLVNERTLHASALYRNGKRTKALTFQAAGKGVPPLRQVATADDIPDESY